MPTRNIRVEKRSREKEREREKEQRGVAPLQSGWLRCTLRHRKSNYVCSRDAMWHGTCGMRAQPLGRGLRDANRFSGLAPGGETVGREAAVKAGETVPSQ